MGNRDNLKLLNVHEYRRKEFEQEYADVLLFAKKYNLTLDLASSEHCIYLADSSGAWICLNADTYENE